MPRRAYLYLNVALAAIATAGVVIGLTLDTRSTPHQPKPQAGKPPVPRNLQGPTAAPIVAAFENWPHGSIDAMQRLGLIYRGGPTAADKRDGAQVQYYRGIALLWAGYPADAEAALELAKKIGRDQLIHNRADEILHPQFLQPRDPPYYPVFRPIRPNPLLERGAILQAQGHQVSAERLFAKAAKLDPADDEAQVAAAVGLFDEDDLSLSFSRLGPLTTRFPRSQVVRYYLGLLLAWTAQPNEAITQFEKVVALGPNTELGKQTRSFLKQIAAAGPGGSNAS